MGKLGPCVPVGAGCWEGCALRLQELGFLKRSLCLAAAPAPEPVSKKPRGQRWKEPPGEEPVRKKRGRPMTKPLDLDPDPDPGEEGGVGSRRKAGAVGGGAGTRTSPEAADSALGMLALVGWAARPSGLTVRPVLPSRSPLT